MKTIGKLAIGALALVPIANGGVPTDPLSIKGFTYHNNDELVSSGDFNGDGLTDLLLISKDNSLVKTAINQGNSKWQWNEPTDAAFGAITDASVGFFKQIDSDSIAIISEDQNNFKVLELLGTGSLTSENHDIQGIGVTTLASLYLPSKIGNYAGLLFATSQNSFDGGIGVGCSPLSDPIQVECTKSDGTNFSVYNTESSSMELRQANAVLFNPENIGEYPHFVAIGTDPPTLKESICVIDFNGSLIYSESVPTNSEFVVAPINSSFPLSIVSYTAGKPDILAFHRDDTVLDGFTPTVVSYDTSISTEISFIRPLVSEDRWRLVIGFDGGTKVSVFEFSDKSTLTQVGELSIPEGEAVFNIASPEGKEILVMSGKEGSGVSEKLGIFTFEDGKFTLLKELEIPNRASNRGHANLLLYNAEPFVEEAPALLASFEVSDWTDKASFNAGSLDVVTETYGGTESGLENPISQSLPTDTTGMTDALVNQRRKDISIVTVEAAIGQRLPDIIATPEPGLFDKIVNVSLSDPTGIIEHIYYRTQPADAWIEYSAAIGPFIEQTTIEAFGSLASGEKTPLTSFRYTFSETVAELDSDGDGVPDFVELAEGLDPEAGDDTDGDTFTDIQEILSGTNAGSSSSMPIFTVVYSPTLGFYVNGWRKALTLYPQVRYLFRLLHDNELYPFQFSEYEEGVDEGGVSSLMTHGVGGGKTDYGESGSIDYINLAIDDETPVDFYYFCSESSGSGSTISVVSPSENPWNSAIEDGPFPILEDNQFDLYVRPRSVPITGAGSLYFSVNLSDSGGSDDRSTTVGVYDTGGTKLRGGFTEDYFSVAQLNYAAHLPYVTRDAGDLLVMGTDKNFYIHNGTASHEQGRELVALTQPPENIDDPAPFEYLPEESYSENASRWVDYLREVYLSRSNASLAIEIDYRDTLILLLVEQCLNEILTYRPFVDADTISLTPFRDPGAPESVAWQTLYELRTPTLYSEADGSSDGFMVLKLYQSILDDIKNNNAVAPTRLRSYAMEVYRLSAELALQEGNEGKYRSPVDVLRKLIRTGELEEGYLTDMAGWPELGNLGTYAQEITTKALTAANRTVEFHTLYFEESLLNPSCTMLENDLGETVALYDADGNPFEFPESMRLTDGIEIKLEGIALDITDSCAEHDYEVLRLQISNVPAPVRIDADANLLLDNYENLVFGATGQDPWGDADGDGFTNLQEFLDGTNPKSASSHGSVVVKLGAPSVKTTVIDEDHILLEFDFPVEYAQYLAFHLEGSDDLINYTASGRFAVEVDGMGHHEIEIDLTSLDYEFYRFMMELKGPAR